MCFRGPVACCCRETRWFRSKRSYDGKCLTHVVVVLRLLGLCCHTWRCGSCFQASHFFVGFYYHIAARVILDRILLSVLYVLSQFYHHVVFEVILFIHLGRNFDFRVLRILCRKCCIFPQFLRLSAPGNTLYASTWSCDIKSTNCHEGSSFSFVPPLMPAASLVLFAALGLSEESSSLRATVASTALQQRMRPIAARNPTWARRTTA